MSGTTTAPPYAAFSTAAFSDQEKSDIRNFCGYPLYGDGGVVFPLPWIMRQYLALEYRMNHMVAAEYQMARLYLSELYTLRTALPAASSNLDTDKAAVWTHNRREVRDRKELMQTWRRSLCDFLGIEPGPNFGGGSAAQCVV